jgi:hypothetical protein
MPLSHRGVRSEEKGSVQVFGNVVFALVEAGRLYAE